MDDRNQISQWLALTLAPNLGPRRIRRLLERHDTPQAVLAAIRAGQGPVLGLDQVTIDHLLAPSGPEIETALTWLQGEHCHLVSWLDREYPALLRQLPDPPPVLYVQGDPSLLGSPQLAMVGSRNPSASGRQTARDFARCLAAAGLTVTSGLALGIDGASHKGALDAEGHTIAVAATGLDRVYPARHRELAHAIAVRGALVSEFMPGTAPRRDHFPRRNRIISGLSLGTLVVEATRQSGSLITARLAADQGREVFAIPGSIHNPLARGCHLLIRQGAKLVETAADIVEELAPLTGSLLQPANSAVDSPADPKVREVDSDYSALLGVLGFDPVPIDLLIQRSGLTAEAVSSMLLLLELEGYVSSAPGGRYCLTGKQPVETGLAEASEP